MKVTREENMKMTKEEFKEWVEKRYRDFLYSHYKFFGDEDITIVISKTGKRIGVAKRHNNDKFDRAIGIAIAYAKAIGLEIPEVCNTTYLSELKNGDTFNTEYDKNTKYIFLAVNPLTKSYIVTNSTGKVVEFYVDMQVYKQ